MSERTYPCTCGDTLGDVDPMCRAHFPSRYAPAQPSASEGERVEQILSTGKVKSMRLPYLKPDAYVSINGWCPALDERFPEGATVEIIARLVPTKGGADHD